MPAVSSTLRPKIKLQTITASSSRTHAERIQVSSAGIPHSISHARQAEGGQPVPVPAARLEWLAAQIDALLPGEKPLEHTFHSGGGWAEDIRWIGRAEQGIGMSSGAQYGAHGFMVIRVAGLLPKGFEFETDEEDRVFQAMLLCDTELESQ